jgi:glutathione S-transferase
LKGERPDRGIPRRGLFPSIASAQSALEGPNTDEAFAAKLASLKAKFARLEEVAAARPYFSDETFHLVDAISGPIFRYFDVFDAHVPLGLFDKLAKVGA